MKGYPTYESSQEYLDKVRDLLDELPAQSDRFVESLFRAFEEGRTIFLAGNGGSAANASHFAQDLAKGTLSSMEAVRRFRAISLTDNIGFITALANDEGYASIFEQQLRNLAAPGDVLVAISGSGNSPNVLRATTYAEAHGLITVGMTGYDGGKLGKMVELNVHVPSFDMGIVESIHGIIVHHVVDRLKERLKAGK